LHAWVTLSPRGAAVWRLLLTRTYLQGERAENSYFRPAAVPLLAALLAALLVDVRLASTVEVQHKKGWTWKAPVGMRLSGDLRRDREF
jgi:hypothetical protein